MSQVVEASEPLVECPKSSVLLAHGEMRKFASKIECVIFWISLESRIIYYCHQKTPLARLNSVALLYLQVMDLTVNLRQKHTNVYFLSSKSPEKLLSAT